MSKEFTSYCTLFRPEGRCCPQSIPRGGAPVESKGALAIALYNFNFVQFG